MRKVLVFIALLGFTVVFSQTSETIKHTASEGESLYAVSKKYNTSVAKILELNPQLEDGIKPGMVLLIPVVKKTETTPTENNKITEAIEPVKPTDKPIEKTEVIGYTPANNDSITYHTVGEGDTYYSLSKKYKTTVSNLQALNNNNPLKIGEKIIVEKTVKLDQKTALEAVKFDEVPAIEKPKTEDKHSQTDTKNIPSDSKEPVLKKTEEVKANTKIDETPKTTPKVEEVKVEKYAEKTVVSVADNKIPTVEAITYENAVKRILIIPFDPYLYFSDADMEIAKQSKMEHTKIRQAFRRRLNALLEPQGYETIHLLGGRIKDSLTDLNKIYKSVKYDYQDALYNPDAQVQRTATVEGQLKIADKTHTVEKNPSDPFGNSRASLAKDEGKYYGVKVFDPNFFPYFNNKYKIDYYIFVNQFEVKTNYQTCLDRTTKNYERSFITHFSIFDKTGKRISGNRIKINYQSNENNIQKILTDNMQNVANQIIGELPKGDK
jgi:LysM repeat protein